MFEIATFVIIGGQIGVFATLGLVVLTAIIGSILLRIQGFELLGNIKREINSKRIPARELIHGVMLMIAGVLLLTPGFVTDICGFLLFIPQIRDSAWHFVKNRIQTVNLNDVTSDNIHDDDFYEDVTIIDLDEKDYKHSSNSSSPWSKNEENE